MREYELFSSRSELESELRSINGWKLDSESKLTKRFEFKAFNDGLAFVNKVAAIADKLDHHPDVTLKWGTVELSIFTHCKKALTKADFELARNIDEIGQLD